MRHEGSDRSAHDVVRRNLARSEDLTLLTDLYDDARERIERSVGPDRRKAIAALEPRANVVDATQHFLAAGRDRRAEEQRSKAESRLDETQREPIRTHLPGRLGEGSRYRADHERRMAEGALFTARQASEQESLRAYEVARHRLVDAETAASKMAVLRGEQDRHKSWLREHPDEVQWARDLRERIEERKADAAGLGRDGRGIERGDRNASRVARAGRSDSRSAKPQEQAETTTHGLDPATVAILRRSSRTSPPKSVSALWALAEQQTADQVLAAHEAAVSTALAFVDEHASFTRRGHNGVVQVDTDGLIAASFVHRTSRAADPQLHTHLLVANKVRAADAKWLSLDGRELFETQKAAGMLYKAALRSELWTRLGVAWTPVDENGVAEVVGVPQALIEQWSARRHELKAVGDELIANREVELGRTLTPNERTECFQIAAYRTRTPKLDADTPTAELRAHWRTEADAWSLGPERWLGNITNRPPRPADLPAEEVVAEVIVRLEEQSATWGRAEVVEEVSRFVERDDRRGGPRVRGGSRRAGARLCGGGLARRSAPCGAAGVAAEARRHGGGRAARRAALFDAGNASA